MSSCLKGAGGGSPADIKQGSCGVQVSHRAVPFDLNSIEEELCISRPILRCWAFAVMSGQLQSSNIR